MKRILMLLIFAGIAGYAPTMLAVPYEINYQGHLTRPDGTPLDTTVAMTFKLYTEYVGGIEYWTETHPSVQVANGLFSVSLGHYAALVDDLFYHPHLYLGVSVGDDGEMNPKVELLSVPYARRVGSVDGAAGGRITGKLNAGSNNTNSGDSAFVFGLNNDANGGYSVVGGGVSNNASGFFSCVPGGAINSASGYGSFASGMRNTASGSYSVALGGSEYVGVGCTAAGTASFAAGTDVDVTGNRSFGFGTKISCAAESAFVWSDGSGPVLSIGTSRTFNVKATYGTRIWSNSDLTAGVRLNAGGSSWISVCDSTKKRNIHGLDTQDILHRFSSLPLKRWEYNSEEPGVEHIGPMAQDFWNAFHLGNEPLGICTIDADGVLFAAVQELAKRTVRIEELERLVAELQAQMQDLKADKQATLHRK